MYASNRILIGHKEVEIVQADLTPVNVSLLPTNLAVSRRLREVFQVQLPAFSKKFRVVQNLVAGNNTINHNLGLISPFATVVQVRDNTTGAETSVRVITETANSLIINVPVALTNQRITIIG